MSKYANRSTVVRLLIVVVTIAATWGALSIDQQRRDVTVTVGRPAPQDFIATGFVSVVDEQATEAKRQEAADAVPDQYTTDAERTQEVLVAISNLFDTVAANVYPEASSTTETTTVTDPEPTTTTPQASTTTISEGDVAGSTTTTEAPKVTAVTGTVFYDADGDGAFDLEAGDAGARGVRVVVVAADGMTYSATTDTSGVFQIDNVPVGTVVVDIDDATLPDHFALSVGADPQSLEAKEGAPLQVKAVGFAPLLRDLETQEQLLASEYPNLQPTTRQLLVRVASEDVMRTALGRPSHLAEIRRQALGRADQLLQAGLKDADDLTAARAALDFTPPPVFLDDRFDGEASRAAGDVVSTLIQINQFKDEAATEARRLEAIAAVDPELVEFQQGQLIVAAGEPVTDVAAKAIEELGLLKQTGPERGAMLLVVILIVGMLIFYLARFREQFWGNTRRVMLFGLLIVLAALVARGAALLTPVDNPAVGYLLPSAMFGFIASVLFDARIAVIMAMAVGSLTGLATQDLGLTLFALLSALTPIPFVSAISARGDLRRAVTYTALTMTPMAAGIAWYFDGPDTALAAGAFGFANGLFLSGLIGIAAISFLEVIFDVTTTLRLLDLTDRNHPALQMIEEKARGTFNHSLMVGTLADRAARAIGANTLLARAAAYYHDIGKTENPQFYIENQFGISNPHDNLPPEESAEILRRHVADGVALAKKYRIPTDVIEGILSHHGDGIMRYFYHKACDRYGADNVDIDQYRHLGHKPRTKETAILMLADALEGATRAVFSEEDPSPEKIKEVVGRVVGEKIADGQLSQCDLTLGELTKVKEAFVEALIGYYHQRINYPGFPQLDELDAAELNQATDEVTS